MSSDAPKFLVSTSDEGLPLVGELPKTEQQLEDERAATTRRLLDELDDLGSTLRLVDDWRDDAFLDDLAERTDSFSREDDDGGEYRFADSWTSAELWARIREAHGGMPRVVAAELTVDADLIWQRLNPLHGTFYVIRDLRDLLMQAYNKITFGRLHEIPLVPYPDGQQLADCLAEHLPPSLAAFLRGMSGHLGGTDERARQAFRVLVDKGLGRLSFTRGLARMAEWCDKTPSDMMPLSTCDLQTAGDLPLPEFMARWRLDFTPVLRRFVRTIDSQVIQSSDFQAYKKGSQRYILVSSWLPEFWAKLGTFTNVDDGSCFRDGRQYASAPTYLATCERTFVTLVFDQTGEVVYRHWGMILGGPETPAFMNTYPQNGGVFHSAAWQYQVLQALHKAWGCPDLGDDLIPLEDFDAADGIGVDDSSSAVYFNTSFMLTLSADAAAGHTDLEGGIDFYYNEPEPEPEPEGIVCDHCGSFVEGDEGTPVVTRVDSSGRDLNTEVWCESCCDDHAATAIVESVSSTGQLTFGDNYAQDLCVSSDTYGDYILETLAVRAWVDDSDDPLDAEEDWLLASDPRLVPVPEWEAAQMSDPDIEWRLPNENELAQRLAEQQRIETAATLAAELELAVSAAAYYQEVDACVTRGMSLSEAELACRPLSA